MPNCVHTTCATWKWERPATSNTKIWKKKKSVSQNYDNHNNLWNFWKYIFTLIYTQIVLCVDAAVIATIAIYYFSVNTSNVRVSIQFNSFFIVHFTTAQKEWWRRDENKRVPNADNIQNIKTDCTCHAMPCHAELNRFKET